MARIHGKNGQVKMDPTGVGGAGLAIVADLNSWTLDASKDRVEVTAFGDSNKIRVAGLPDYSGTLGGWWDDVRAALFPGGLWQYGRDVAADSRHDDRRRILRRQS